jgi:hypothetical protein
MIKWIVSIMEIKDAKGRQYKVTRRIPELNVAETKFFRSKKAAEKKFLEWLN